LDDAAQRQRPEAGAQASAKSSAQAATGPSIQLRKWQPDEPYARRLRGARAEDLYAIYLDERPAYAASTAFFLDVADILFERGQAELAARVLSNLAEMNLENRHVLRILAYRLVLAGQLEPALPVLEKVLALSPDEPQSYRDLGLALAQANQPQRAIEQLWEVVSRPWHGRFPGIEGIALAELNAIAARQPGLDTRRIDARLLRNLPLDLRAVLAWDADNTDIDLWVIDPNGERAFYGHRRTRQGGQMSQDFTGGYGPEEFSLRKAKPGTYTVKAQFYGHQQQIVAPATTLMLRLSSGFGTAAQKDEDVVLRLSGSGAEVMVGTFTVGAGPRP
jgi:tetratricopeptide (TPR) repeat protein